MHAPIRRSSVLASLLAVALTGSLASAGVVPAGAPNPPVQDSSERGYLGINMTVEDGAMVVQRVLSDSPAERAGLRPGDRITRIGEHKIENEQALGRHLGGLRVGQTVMIQIDRDGWVRDVEVALAAPNDVWTEEAPNVRTERRRDRADRDDRREKIEVIETPVDVDVFKRADGGDAADEKQKVEILFGESPVEEKVIVEVSPDANADGERRVWVRRSDKQGAKKDKTAEVLESLGQSDEYENVRSRVRAGTRRELDGQRAGADEVRALRDEVRALRRDVDALLEMRAELRRVIETLESQRRGGR